LSILACTFIAFRYFDVRKPLGIKWLENNLKKASPVLSIMFDDVLGGIYAMIAGYGILTILK
jgi:phosphatidylglycerophosphatase A